MKRLFCFDRILYLQALFCSTAKWNKRNKWNILIIKLLVFLF